MFGSKKVLAGRYNAQFKQLIIMAFTIVAINSLRLGISITNAST